MKRSVAVRVALLLLAGVCAGAQARSLYEEAAYRPLTADRKAFRPGDVLTVQVFEQSSASATADTGTRRRNDLEANLRRPDKSSAFQAAVGGSFDGGGRTERSNRVLITLSVSVREVADNGDLVVAGEQLLLVNGEQQRVSVQGRVRPQDVSDANVVLSTRMADARITYMGEGELSQRQQRAWWRQFLDWAGL